MKFQWRLSLIAIMLCTLISGCSTPTNTYKPQLSTTEQKQLQAEKLLSKATQAKPIASAELRAKAATLLMELGQKEKASQVLELIDISLLPPSLRFEIALLKSATALEQSRPEDAIRQLDKLQQISTAPLSREQKITILQTRSEAYQQQELWLSKAKALIQLGLLIETESTKQEIHDQIWSTLLNTSPADLSMQLQSGENSYYVQGWLELINEITHNKQLDTQHQAIENWSLLWEAHPARILPPSSLTGLGQETLKAHKIAILLPNKGKLARPAAAIREGILMAHLRMEPSSSQKPELLFLDSEAINTPIQLSAIVDEQNIDLIIGPLDKKRVTALASDNHIRIPILALNYSDAAGREGLYQFGLSAEDETKQIASRVWNDGAKNVAILTPDTAWGVKISQAFKVDFAELGGSIVSESTFSEISEYSTNISRLVATDNSKARYQKLRQITQAKFEFEEYRRQDIDAIVITALPNDARQLAPILAFNFAGDLPTYATSHIYSGSSDPVLDQDLNNILFLDTPWNLKPPSQDKLLISQQRTDTNSRFGRLYALGLDAYRIYPYLRQLSSIPGTAIQGETGTIQIDQNGLIARSLLWARYKDGTPQLVE
ncbi:penicillin-binding protein activator [uncultured Neptuniibacter sp.]|uniref:penicillin-binding protein activator n=1 Tax=uncultured Neptuniibacter sp. TaxID=502143 RepID=UPI0026098CC8|nr:penicillin-binding protein activator [uncultured Neptuniibacter sp.]